MNLTHTTHAGYIRQDDVYTDENGVNYTVRQDTDSGDPRSWIPNKDVAIVVVNADRNTRTDNINDYDDNPAIDDLLQAMERDEIDDPSDITTQWWNDWKKSLAKRNIPYDVDMIACHGYDQSTWFTVIAAAKEGYGSARSNIDTFVMWANGDVWTTTLITTRCGASTLTTPKLPSSTTSRTTSPRQNQLSWKRSSKRHINERG